MSEADFKKLRELMVSEQIYKRGILDQKILKAFNQVPRHCFIPVDQLKAAYADHPLSIGCEQTISQPYMVALMTQELKINPGNSVLEVGTGSGYQTAILLALGARVYSLERIASLAQRAKVVLTSLGYKPLIKVADGSFGWPEYAPYDRIIVTAASAQLPQDLLKQLKIGGRLIAPIGRPDHQELVVFHKISEQNIDQEKICGCIFVPLLNECVYEE